MDVCLVGSWAKIPNGEDGLEMAENIFLNRDNITSLPEEKLYLKDFREKHPDVKAALVNGIEYFDDQYFGTGESEAICMDPQQRMLMQGVIQALENAGITIEMASEARVSVYTAAWAYDYKDLLPPDQYMATGNSASVMCGRITYFLNSRGAAVGIETACSSSLVAFHLARQAILSGETKLALVCGANHVGSRSFHSLYNSHMVSPNGRLAAFDRSANGFVRAEAFAVAVLCSREFAEENNLRIQCECIGSAFNSDGKTPSLTAPNPISQYEVQMEALKNIDKDSVQLVTCHGTGTKLGDQVELTAIKKSFKPDIRVMSPKSSMGHGEGAAGLIGVLQSLYSMQQGIIPNQIHMQLPSEDLGEEKSMGFINEEMDLKRVAISSYGFGGTNACAIIAQPKTKNAKTEAYAESNVLFLSAKSHESLKVQISEYANFLKYSDSEFEDILYTINERKTKYDVRASVFGKNREEMATKLQNGDYSLTNSQEEGLFEVEFGEGNEKLWLLRMLYEKNETFHAAVDKYCKLAESCGFPEARTALFFPFKLTLTPLTYNVSRLISSMATFELLVQYKVLPNKMRGKGLGHIFCLAAAKVITFENAVLLIKGVVAEANLTDILGSIDLKNSKIPIEIQHLKTSIKTILPIHVSGELKETSLPNLMTFKVNGKEILEVDPVKKVQKLICELFSSGLDPVLNFRGQIVKTPGYSFLKRKFWSEPISTGISSSVKEEETNLGISDEEIEATVQSIVKQFLDIEETDVNLLETGAVDSLTSIEMIEAFGTFVGLTMPFDLLESYPTTKNIVEYLKTLVSTTPSSKTTEAQKKKSTASSSISSINVIASDFMFAGVEGGKELWDTLLTSKLVTGRINDTRKKQCEGDCGLEVGLLKQDISLFDNSFFSIAKDESEFVDPQHRLLLHAAYNTLEKSGLSAIPDADLFLAISAHSEYRALAEKRVDELDERLWMGTVHSMAAGRLAALMGIRGRAVIVDTTCSSVATALEMAVNSIRDGKKYAVVATSQLIQSSKWLYSLKSLLDHHTTKSFSIDGTGFCRSDGVGVVILKAAEDGDSALIQITDAKSHHCGAVITPVVGAISQLLEDVGDISYVEGHGTATSAGDSAESMAYQKIGQELVMSSVKAQFGHCEVASGLIQLMKVALLSNHGVIPAVVHNYLPNDHIRHNDNIRLPFVSEEKDVTKSAIVSFGITGTKTVVTTERFEGDVVPNHSNCFLFPISAKTKDALKKTCSSLIEMLENTNESLFNISTNLQKQKTNFKWRTAVVGSKHSDVVKNFKKILTNEKKEIYNNWHVPTFANSMGCSSFFNNIPEFEDNYSEFCNRLRFEPHSNTDSIYHLMAVIYSLLKHILKHNVTSSFAVGGFNSLVLLSVIDAAPSHYLNDLLHAFANNDIRMMKRIARDVTISVENVEMFNLRGEVISTARQAVEAAIDFEPKYTRLSEETLILSPNESCPQTETLQNVKNYFQLIGEKYVKGSQTNFAEIFGKPTKLIDLPEYPYNRKHFWLPIPETSQITSAEYISKSPDSYEFLLNSEKWRHVKNHVIDSKVVLPGATSIRLVHQLSGKASVTLCNVDFLNKITPTELPIQVKIKEEEDLTTLIFGQTDAISYTLTDAQNVVLVPNERLNAEVHYSDEIYQRFSASHLTYRNEFQMIESLRYTMGRGEARFVEMKDLDILIDGTLQAIVGCYFFENQHDHSPFVPFTIDNISIVNGKIAQKQLHTILTYESSDNFITGNATVYDVFGEVILHISNVSFKRLDGQSVPSIASKTVNTTSVKKSTENETAKRDSKNMLHLWFEENFGWTDIDNSTGFFDLGLTSIQAVKLRNAIKSNYPNASSTCVFDYPSIELLSGYLSTLHEPEDSPVDEDNFEHKKELEEEQPATRLSQNPIGVMAAACRLPGGISSPAELWELLKIGKNASSRIPATRVPTRNNLISGAKYGNPVEGGNFITQDISQFDPAFFKISKSEAELIDPQQRILLECVQECLENSGVTETSNVGVFVGLMEKEYQDMMESSSILAMLGSMAAVIAGRVNYVFGCYGPSVTIDTACSSSLVALEMAVNALLDNRCSKVIVAGVNLILNEKGQGLRTNGKMLSQHGMSLSFDSRASGYGRSDGCVVLMLELAKPNFRYMSTIQSVNVNHGGRSVSLTAPNGVAHKMLLTSVINQSPSLAIDYWEAHGTGTPLGDPIEFNTLSSILQNIIIGSVKASLGHGEASAGTCGLLKLFMMLTYQYVPTLIHFHVLNKDISSGSIRLPVIGEDAELVSAGISSFGVSGTNAAAIAFNDNNKLEPYTPIHKHYILPLSAKNQYSLDQLEKQILSVIPQTDVPISNISSALANNRSHFTIRNALIVSQSGTVISKKTGKPHRAANRERMRLSIANDLLDPSMLQYDVINEFYTIAELKNTKSFAMKFAVIKFITSLSEFIEIVPSDNEELLAVLLCDGSLKWEKFDKKLLDLPNGSLLNELSEHNVNIVNSSALKLYQSQPESLKLDSPIKLLELIVNMYITGYDLDWTTVYSPVDQFVLLPNYQFNKQSLWFEERDEVVDHYLIGTVDERTEDKLILKNQMSELRHPQFFKGKPLDVGTMTEIAIEALKIQNEIPFSIQNLKTTQITLTKPAWLKTIVEKEDDMFNVSAFIDDKELFSLSASALELDSIELPAVEVQIPDKVVYLRECPNAIVRRHRNLIYVNSSAEPSPFRTANIVLNEIIGFSPNPSDMFVEILGVLPNVYYMVQVDDGALWQFQIISQDRQVLSNIFVLKDAKGLEVPTLRMHKKSTLLSSQEASMVAAKTLQMDVRNKVCLAVGDVVDLEIEIDESQMSTGFSELGMDSLATVDLLNRLNQKYFPEIELTTSDLFDNPNIIDLSLQIELLLKEKGITAPQETNGQKLSIRERKLSIPAVRAQELAQIEFVENYNSQQKTEDPEPEKQEQNNEDQGIGRTDIRRKISSAVFDLATDSLTDDDLNSKGFTELGMDSLSIVDFVNRLNEKYFPGDDITTSDVFDYPTVDELADHITRKKSVSVPVESIANQDNNGIVEPEIIISEPKKDIELLKEAYLLVTRTTKDTSGILNFTTNGSNLILELNRNVVLQLNEEGGQESELKRIMSGHNQILINLDNYNGSTENLYMTLLNFVKFLAKNKIKCHFTVSQSFKLGNSIAKAFLKTVTSEKFPSISLEWDQRIQQISFVNDESPITGNWLITGGLSGIGFEIGKFLAKNGAENVILVSRRSPSDGVVKEIKTWNAKVHTIAADISDKSKLIQELGQLNVNITGMIHSAGILKDSKIERQTKDSFKQVFKPKADGLVVLEEIENHFRYNIEHFIMMSSFTSACGNEGQLNYAVANAYLEYNVQRRRREGKSGCAIQWGNWIDTGMATNANVRKFLADLGFLGQHNEDALKYLRACIQTKPEIVMVANIDWQVILKNREDLPRDLIVEGVVPFASMIPTSKEDSTPESPNDFEEISIDVAVEDVEDVLELIKEKIASIIKCQPSKLKHTKNIMDMGLDSRHLMELLTYLNSTFKIRLNLSDAYNHSTLEKLSCHIWDHIMAVNSKSKEEEITPIERNKISIDFCPVFGINVFFDKKEHFDSIKAKAAELLENGKQLPMYGNYSIPIVGTSIQDVVTKIKSATIQQVKQCQPKSKTVLMLTGQGSQYPMMGRQLVENYEIFGTTLKSCLEKCDHYLQGEVSLWEILFNPDHYQKLQLTKHMQPIMFSFGYAVAQLWLSLGIVPDYYLGHSVGELVAGVLAGIMSIEDGLHLIVERGKAMENIAGLGALLAVQREVADDVLRKFNVTVATINSPKQVVFAGTKKELDLALAFVKGQGKQGTYVNQLYPFHSNLIEDSHLVGLRKCLSNIKFRQGATPLVSNVTGQIINTFSETYIIKHTVSAVKFVNCVETLQNEGVAVWIDAGPAAVLATFVKRIITPTELSKHRIVQTCKEKDSDVETLVQSCLELEQCGLPILWSKLYGCDREADSRLMDFPVLRNYTILDNEFEILEGHRLNGKIIVAGAYQMFKMDQLVKSRTSGLDLVLRNVKFLKPWYIESGKEYEIRWNSDLTIELIVKSVVVCSARVEMREAILEKAVCGSDENTFDVHEFYETLYRNGLQYESGFRRIETAQRSDKKCFAHLKPSPFAWPLIDSAMHSITASVVVRRPDSYFLPVAMGTVFMKPEQDFQHRDLQAQTVITSETEKFIQVNVLLFAGNELISEVRNMTIVVAKLDSIGAPNSAPNHVDTIDKPKTEIEIVGFDITLPYNQMSNKGENWQFLKLNKIKQKLQNRNIQDYSRVALLDINARYWDPEYFGIRPSEAQFIDPQQRLLLTSVANLLDSLLISDLPSNTGVFIGCSTHEFSHIVYAHDSSDPKSEWSSGTCNSALAGRIAHWLKLKGPVLTVDTACSSSTFALSAACDALQYGKCDYAIVGAVNLVLHEMTSNVLQNAQMTVEDWCRPFDVHADGYKRSECVSTVLLSRSQKFDNIATIINWETGHNGNSSSLFTPNGKSQFEIMKRATATVEHISGVEAHCTGTKLGDPIELNAISRMVDGNCYINSIKSNIGHSEGASGFASLCTFLLNVNNEYSPAQLHLRCPTKILRESRMICRFIGEEFSFKKDDTFLVNNFGFTGSNCSLVIRPKGHVAETLYLEGTMIYYPMLLSAHTSESLRLYIQNFSNFVQLSSESLLDISQCLLRKKVHAYRFFIIYNYKRKCVLSHDDVYKVSDNRLNEMVDKCQTFIREGRILFEKQSKFKKVQLPSIVFKNSLHWKLKPFRDEIDSLRPKELKNIFLKKILVKVPHSNFSSVTNVVCIGKLNLAPEIELDELSIFSNGIIVFHPIATSVEEFLKLTQIWTRIPQNQNVTVIICCFKNSTSHTEWTGTLRTLASEKLIPYKFVSIETLDDIKSELNTGDLYECIFYNNRTRFVERLRRITPNLTSKQVYEKVLMSGGSGGIGKAIINEIRPQITTIISRQQRDNENGKSYIIGSVQSVKLDAKYDHVFHLAGDVQNAIHSKIQKKSLEEMVATKLHGARNLAKCCSKNGKVTFSSSIACILGSFGQSNYVFANGLATSFLQSSGTSHNIIHWGPWKEVGMLSHPERAEIIEQLQLSGWNSLSNLDALSVFQTDAIHEKSEIIVFDGDFEKIVALQPHLQNFLSEIVVKDNIKIAKIHKDASFESVFHEITGIDDIKGKEHVPFMDLGIDSLCIENLRQSLNQKLGLELSVSEMFEYATHSKLSAHVENLLACKSSTTSEPSLIFDKNKEDSDKVAVIGWSGEFSGAENIEEYWKNLLDGAISTEKNSNFLKSPYGFDNQFFKITDEDAKVLDPQLRKFVQHAYLALENAGYSKTRNELKCAIFAGAEPSDYGNPDNHDDAMKKLFSMNMNNFLASYASYCLDLKGEAVSVYSACSTTLVAIATATKAILSGSTDYALVGAASISDTNRILSGQEDQRKTIFSPTGTCRPFDSNSEGIVRGSGVGCLLLKKLSRAMKDGDNIHFVINSFAVSNDGHSRASFMAPNPAGQLSCMTEVLSKLSSSEKERIEYVECHATGTVLGDTIELSALQSAYSYKSKLSIGSCKANIGHAYAASGLASLIKCGKMLQTRQIPPQVNFSNFRGGPSNFFKVNTKCATLRNDSMISIDSFGIGGTNVHMIIELPTQKNEKIGRDESGSFVVPFSANCVESLQKLQVKMENHLRKEQKCFIEQLASTQIHYRMAMDHRNFLMVSKRNNVLKISPGTSTKINGKSGKIALFFAPQGIQYSNILLDDYQYNKKYRQIIGELCEIAESNGLHGMKEALYPSDTSQYLIEQSKYAQVAIFIQCLAILKSLKSILNPNYLIGHSIGEYTAAVVGGVTDERKMMKLLKKRSELMETTDYARMLMIWNYNQSLPNGVEISAIIDESTKCVVGPVEEIDAFEKKLIIEKIKFRNIPTKHGFHSKMLQRIKTKFEESVRSLRLNSSSIPIISSVTGTSINSFDANYCGMHLVNPVKLDLVVDWLVTSDVDVVVEIGPTGVLSNLLLKRNSKIVVIPTCGSKKHPKDSLAECVGILWNHGVDVSGMYEKLPVCPTAPGYCFAEKEFRNSISYSNLRHSSIEKSIEAKEIEFYSECWISKNSPLPNEMKFVVYSKNEKSSNVDSNVLVVELFKTDDVHENYFDVQEILKAPTSYESIIFIANDDDPSVHIVLGLLRCHHLLTKMKLVYVQNFENCKVARIVSSALNSKSYFLRVTETIVLEFELIRRKIGTSLPLRSFGGSAVIFGANGFVGSQISSLLKKHNIDVFSVSRATNYHCDITNRQEVEDLFKTLNLDSVDFVINCVGVESVNKIRKSKEEQIDVLSAKTIGNLNLMNCIKDSNIAVGKFITFSSLSSIIPLLGNEDYAAANCFVESLPQKKPNNIQQMLVLSLPPLQDSRMYQTSSESTKNLLKNTTITTEELNNVLKTALTSNLEGICFVSSENPHSLANKSIAFHRTDDKNDEVASTSLNDDCKKPTKFIVAKIWSETIGITKEIDSSANFFSLGGDSLSALQVVWQIQKQLDKTVDVNDLFDFPTLGAFSELVENKNSNPIMVSSSRPAPDYDNVPLTHSQTQMFVLHQIENTSKYNVIFEIDINHSATFSRTSLKYSILSLIAYQTSYRTIFVNSKNPRQLVCSLTESFHNLDDRCDLFDAISHESNHSFEIGKLTPLRVRISENGVNNRIRIVFNQHHILTDGWSMTVLADTINNLYNAYEKKTIFPVKSNQTISYVAMKEKCELEKMMFANDEALRYFGKENHTVIPYDVYEPSLENHKRFVKNVPKNVWSQLISLSQKHNTTLYNISLAIFCDCVRSFTGQSNLLLAYASSGRNADNSELIGYFINNVLLKVKMSDNVGHFGSLLDTVSKSLDQSRKFSNVPFHMLVEKNRNLNAISTFFNFRQKLDYPTVSIPGAICSVKHISLNNAFDFSFTLDETPEGSVISIDYDSSKYVKSTIELFSETFLKTVNVSKVKDKFSPMNQADYPSTLLKSDLLNSWGQDSNTALSLPFKSISYRELLQEVKRTAQTLQKQFQVKMGNLLREDDLIGVNSRYPPVSILACCLLGVPYAPIEPVWPAERISYVESKTFMVFNHFDNSSGLKIRNFHTRTEYGGVYTIFTSGSTGAPKGVFMSEKSVCTFVKSATKQCLFRENLRVLDSVKQVFDVSVSNIFGSILNGGVLISPDQPTSITDKLQECQYAFIPAAVFNGFTHETITRLANMETLTVGGETVSDSAIRKVLINFPALRIIQIYGPTETCVWSLTNRCQAFKNGIGSIIGLPMENEHIQVGADDIRGNLRIQGDSLARGYLSSNSEGNSFSHFYSTGDIVDRRSGKLKYIGRIDSQIKWKGLRIDLAETEKELLLCLCFCQISVIVFNQMLIAFFVSQSSICNVEKLRMQLKHKTVIPDHFVQLDKMPLNSSGKIEKALLLQAFENMQKSYQREMVLMENSLEEKVNGEVSSILGRKTTLNDKFTNVGGNSVTSIQLANQLTEKLKVEVKAHEILQSENLRDLSATLAKNIEKPTSTVPNVITKLREVPNSKLSIYLVHAIGGTIYPYYSFLQIFPKNISLYGIEFDLKYPSSDLRELAHFYAREIAAHAGQKRIFVMGHSMGGIMSREIVTELKIWGYEIPFVMLFDSWVLRTNELDIENIKQFITYVFSGLPDSEHRIDRAIKLAQLLREYKTSISNTKLYLFKSKQLGDAAFKKAVRTDLNEELSRSMVCNGFDELSLQPIETFLIDGDHESCLKVENLRKVKEQILAPFKPYFDDV